MENWDTYADINRAQEIIRDNIRYLAKDSQGYKLKQNKPFFWQKIFNIIRTKEIVYSTAAAKFKPHK
jgi:hypothetical protein